MLSVDRFDPNVAVLDRLKPSANAPPTRKPAAPLLVAVLPLIVPPRPSGSEARSRPHASAGDGLDESCQGEAGRSWGNFSDPGPRVLRAEISAPWGGNYRFV